MATNVSGDPVKLTPEVTEPANPDVMRAQIETARRDVTQRAFNHDRAGGRYEAFARWLRLLVTLASGVSALTVIADSGEAATIFALLTALFAAINAGFSPPETAKAHRDAARGYARLRRPIEELRYRLDSYYHYEARYVPQVGHTSDGQEYDAGYYDGYVRTGRGPSKTDRDQIWAAFMKCLDQREAVDENAPWLRSNRQGGVERTSDAIGDLGRTDTSA